MRELILFHGTPDKIVVPTYGKGEEKHDYGQGFYLTDSIDLAKEFVRDNIDIDILEELLLLGGLGIQYCIKSELAYSKLQEVKEELLSVDYTEFREKYNQRDISARQKMRELVDSDANKVTKVFSTLL